MSGHPVIFTASEVPLVKSPSVCSPATVSKKKIEIIPTRYKTNLTTIFCFPARRLRTAMRRVRRQRRVPALRREDLRGLQGLLQENCSEERQVRLSGGQELPRGQAEEEPVPVLQVSKVSRRRHGQGGCPDRLSQGSERTSSNKAPGERH